MPSKQTTLVGMALLGLLLAPLHLAAHHSEDDETLSPYSVVAKVDLTVLLAPAPAPDSVQTKKEIDELLGLQASRTDAQAAAAVADHVYSVFRFGDVLGPDFTPDKLPLTAAMFARIVDTGKAVVEPAKDFWKRERPGDLDSRIQPVMKDPKSGSYPSGHATAGNLMAIVLANMVPEKSAELYERGWNFSYNRLVAGAHYPSDIEAGRIAATVIASYLFKDEEFRRDFVPARAELRQALGYPPVH
jgi:acid phosphatase (class A)